MLNNKTIKPMLVAMSSAVPGLLDPVFSYNEWPVAFWVTVSYYRGIFGRVWWRLGLSGELPIPHFPDPVPHASVYPGSETEHTETKKIEGRKGMVNKEKLSRVLFDTLRRLKTEKCIFFYHLKKCKLSKLPRLTSILLSLSPEHFSFWKNEEQPEE